MKEPKPKLSLNDLAKALNISPSVAQSLGKHALLNQLGETHGHPTTRCEDASASGQYTGDLENDIGHLIK